MNKNKSSDRVKRLEQKRDRKQRRLTWKAKAKKHAKKQATLKAALIRRDAKDVPEPT